MSTTLSCGYLADIIEQSNQWRRLGPARYNLSGMIQFIRNKSSHFHLQIHQKNNSTNEILENLCGKSCSSSAIEVEGDYELINCLNVSCRCVKSRYGMSPFVKCDDGLFDLVLVKHSTRTNFLRFLLTVANDSTNLDQLSNVQRYRTNLVRIIPSNSNEVHWSCDGELIQAKSLLIRSHQQIFPLFATGIHFQQIN